MLVVITKVGRCHVVNCENIEAITEAKAERLLSRSFRWRLMEYLGTFSHDLTSSKHACKLLFLDPSNGIWFFIALNDFSCDNITAFFHFSRPPVYQETP